jgi:hypothetical protein
MKKYFILLSFLSIALFSCQQKSEDSDSTEKVEIVESNSPVTSIFSDDNEYFPAKAGVSWTYGRLFKRLRKVPRIFVLLKSQKTSGIWHD